MAFTSKDIFYFQSVFSIAIRKSTETLSRMINKDVSAEEIKLEMVSADTFPNVLGGPDNELMCIYLSYTGEKLSNPDAPKLRGHLFFSFNLNSSMEIVKMLTQELNVSSEDTSKLMISAIGEVGNVFTTSLLNILSSISGYKILPSTPEVVQHKAGLVLSHIQGQVKMASSDIFLVKTNLTSEGKSIEGQFFLFPEDPEKLKALI
jgi:chemotaxis protein CheC